MNVSIMAHVQNAGLCNQRSFRSNFRKDLSPVYLGNTLVVPFPYATSSWKALLEINRCQASFVVLISCQDKTDPLHPGMIVEQKSPVKYRMFEPY